MKNITLFFILFISVFFVKSAFATDDVMPQWDSLISPEQYAREDLNYIENDTVCHQKPWLCALGAITFVGIPGVIISSNRSNQIEKNNYWFKRKQEFEIQRNLCNAMTNNDKKINCYLQLRQSEYNKTLKEEELSLRRAELNAYLNQQSRYNSAINQHYNHSHPTRHCHCQHHGHAGCLK